jgi:hypothetical protein
VCVGACVCVFVVCVCVCVCVCVHVCVHVCVCVCVYVCVCVCCMCVCAMCSGVPCLVLRLIISFFSMLAEFVPAIKTVFRPQDPLLRR